MLRRLVILFVVLLSAVTISTVAIGVADKVVPTCEDGHTWDLALVTEQATCTEEGKLTKTCKVCGETEESVIDALGHDLVAVAGSAKEPSCEEDGYTGDKECLRSGCSYIEEGEVIPADGHDYDKVVTAPTCEEDGYTTYTCDCGKSYIADEVDALGHAYGEWTSNGDGTHKRVCANDTAHVESGNCAGGTATCQELAECSVCGGEHGKLLAHTYNQEVAASEYLDHEANCQSPATYFKSCACGAKGTETFTVGTPGGHNYYIKDDSEANLASGATCTEPAKYFYTCVCGQKGTETFSNGEALGHRDTEVNITAKAPTCTEAGCTEGVFCNDCNTQIKESESIEAIGHDYEGVVTAPTCEDAGYTTYTCKNDSTHTYVDDEVAALGHDYEGVVTAPTCDDAGYTTYTCKNDATHTYVDDEVAALGHDYEGVVTAPTCDDAGYTTYTCKNDSTHTYVDDEVAALGHDYESVVTNPTCTEVGYTTYTCKNDSTHTYIDDEVAALGHSFIEGVGICSICGVNKAEISFVTSAQGYTNAQEISKVEIDGIKFTFDKGSNSNSSKYYNDGAAIRMYGDNSLTITGISIEKIVFTFGSGDKTNAITANVGTFATNTWTGNANEVVFTIGGTSGHRRIASITVFCEKVATCEECTSSSFGSNDTYHWSICDVCKIKYAPKQHDCTVQNTADDFIASVATCTAKATYFYSCECGYKSSNTFEHGSTLDHTMTHYEAVVPTCSATGNVEYWACSVCEKNYDAEQNGNIIDNVVLEADEDNHIDTTITKAAKESTCTEEGNTATVHCNDCDTDIETSTTISKKPHTMTHYEAVASTCSATGNVEYWACSSCSMNYDAEQGGNVLTKVTIDTLDCVDENSDNICDKCGETLCASHNPTNWTKVDENTHIGTCEACHKTTTAGHNFDAGVVTAPTCTTDGYTTYTCVECSYSYKANPTTALGHTESEAVRENEQAATCTATGSYDSVVYCSVCGDELSRENKEIPVANHTMTHHEAVASTCSATGNVEYWACSVCGENYDAAQNGNVIGDVITPINAEAHKWNDGEETTSATCTEAGVKTYTCQDNNEHTKTEAIPATGHTFVDGKCVCGATKATLTFDANKENRVSYSTSKQVWSQNGITFTNDKASSTSNVADYGNPVRLYKNSTITIDMAKMLSISFTTTGGDYLTALQSSISDKTVSGNIVTITFAEATDSITIILSGGQVRLNSIEVIYMACSHTNTEEIPAVAATCNKTGLTAGEKCSDCGEILTAQEEVPMVEDCVDEDSDNKCDWCGSSMSCEHNYSGELTEVSDTQHSVKCLYCDSTELVNHAFDGDPANTSEKTHTVACDCGATIEEEHSYDGTTNKCACGREKVVSAEVEYTYGIVDNFSNYNSGWSNSYGSKTIASDKLGTNLPTATITMSNVSKQTTTITDRPVLAVNKNTHYVTVEVTDKVITKATFDLTVWSSSKRFSDIHIEYFDGTSWQTCSSAITSPAAITSNKTFEATKVRLSITTTNSGNQQIGIGNITLTMKQLHTAQPQKGHSQECPSFFVTILLFCYFMVSYKGRFIFQELL